MTNRRDDIDGLRAVAILAVLGYHAFPHSLPGGYAGVDVFFVVSGYLISRIIVGADFTFSGFYARRLRRIVPALALVLVFCLVTGWFKLLSDEYEALGKHVAGGAGFVENLILMDEVGYFDTAAATKPLLHLWSLGIEEQFYLVWPLFLRVGRRRALAVMVVAFVLSFGAALVAPSFYAPWTRLWELMIGAGLTQLKSRRAPVLSAIGMLAIAAGLAFPLQEGLLIIPTLGTALAIGAGEGTWFARHVLSNPVATWLGRISFPLYLWHWPLLVFLEILAGGESATQRAGVLAVSVVLADLTYRLLERPVQRGPTRPFHVFALGGALLTTGVAGTAVWLTEGCPSRAIVQMAPDFRIEFLRRRACYDTHPYVENGGTCHESPRKYPRTLVMLGDSHGQALAQSLVNAPLEKNVLVITRYGCLPFRGAEFVLPNGHRPFDCRKVFDPAFAEILADASVETVVLVARHSIRVSQTGFQEPEAVDGVGHFELADGKQASPAEVYRRALVDTIGALHARGIRVLFVDQVPELGFDPRTCVSRSSWKRRTSCSLPRSTVDERQRPYRAVVDEVLAHAPGVIRIDPVPLFCTATECSAWRGDEMMYSDDDHLSPKGAAVVTAEIVKRLTQ